MQYDKKIHINSHIISQDIFNNFKLHTNKFINKSYIFDNELKNHFFHLMN
jgi:hypothetical protein